MKLVFDVQLSYLIAEELVGRGHDADAITTRGDIPNDLPDFQVLAIAHGEKRAVVTNNIKDFRPLAAQRIAAGSGHSGLILVASSVRRTKASVTRLADRLEELIVANPGGLADGERWIGSV